MKATGVFLLLALALCCYQGFAEANRAAGRGTEVRANRATGRGIEPACDNFNLSRGCTRNFEPICGTDDVLYSNECLLCLQNRQRGANVRIKHRGMCQNPNARSTE